MRRISFKNEKGITLIALTVTIIILLILTGVTITAINLDDGVIGKIIKTKKEIDQTQVYENVKQAAITASMLGREKINTDNLKRELSNYFGDEGEGFSVSRVENDGFSIMIREDESSYYLEENGNLRKINNYDVILPDEYQRVEYIESTGT